MHTDTTSSSGPDHAPRAPVFKLVKVLALLVLVAIPLTLLCFGWLSANHSFTPAARLGPVLHVPADGGGRVILLTGQWRTHFLSGRYVSSRTYTTDLLVDLWAFSDADARPLWRKRLEKEPSGAMYDRAILGAQQDTVWLLMNARLIAVSAHTGEVTAPVGHIEAVNPPLHGMMPTDPQYFSFDAQGLLIKAADAREWRIDPESFVAYPAGEEGKASGVVSAPATYVAFSSGSFQERGLKIPGAWLGLLSDAEAKSFDEANVIGGMDRDTRRRLWKAKATKEQNFFGEIDTYSDFAPLPAAPDFLDAGLLKLPWQNENFDPIWLREPDSVLVLHRERLGDEGKFHLSRVAGPDGTLIWDAVLPLTTVQSLIPLEKTLVLYGKESRPEDVNEQYDRARDAPDRLVVLELASGAIHVHDSTDIENHITAEPVETGL